MASDGCADTRLSGTLRSADGKGIVRIEGRIDADIDDLWSALTDPQRLARWLGDIDGALRRGGEFSARFFASGWEGSGRVKACDPPRQLLVQTMSPDEEGEHFIEVTLTADANQTRLAWEERGLPVNLLAEYGAGIQVHVEDLASHIRGRERCDAQARWAELHSAYQALAINVG